MPACFVYNVGIMSSHQQYTIRGIPSHLDKKLRQKAKEMDTSLNQVILDTLGRATGTTADQPVYHDLDGLIGSWQEDAAFDAAVAAQHKIDRGMWK